MSCCWLCGIGGAAATCLLSIPTTMPRIVLPLPVAFCWRFSCRWVLAPVCPKDGHRRQQYDFRSGATCAAAYFRSLVRRHVRPAVHSIRCSIKLKHIKLITFGSIRRCRLTHIHCICCILQSYNNYIINCSHLMESPREYTLHSGTVWIMSLLFSVTWQDWFWRESSNKYLSDVFPLSLSLSHVCLACVYTRYYCIGNQRCTAGVRRGSVVKKETKTIDQTKT